VDTSSKYITMTVVGGNPTATTTITSIFTNIDP
jgi:hypothetical protein